VLTVIMTITRRFICRVNSYCDNIQYQGGQYVVLTVIVTITGRTICSASSYCENNDNNGEVYAQC
jgi:hypothetical protein